MSLFTLVSLTRSVQISHEKDASVLLGCLLEKPEDKKERRKQAVALMDQLQKNKGDAAEVTPANLIHTVLNTENPGRYAEKSRKSMNKKLAKAALALQSICDGKMDDVRISHVVSAIKNNGLTVIRKTTDSAAEAQPQFNLDSSSSLQQLANRSDNMILVMRSLRSVPLYKKDKNNAFNVRIV